MDDELRALGHAARAEVEADVDVDEAWSVMSADRAQLGSEPWSSTGRPPWGWVAAAAAAVAVFAAGVLALADRSGDTIQSAEEPTGNRTVPAAAPMSSTSTTTIDPGQTTTVGAVPNTSVPVGTAPITTITTLPQPGDTSAAATTTTTTPDDPSAAAWRDFEWEGSSIRRSCAADGRCTQIRIAVDGTAVSFDPVSRELVRHSVPPVSATVPSEFGEHVWLELVGPDDVAYLAVDPLVPDADGLAADLVAIALAEGDAGREIGRWSGVTDQIGDHDLVPTPSGIVIVGCCGPDTVRPTPTAEIVVEWIDRDGQPVSSGAASVRVEHVDGGYLLVRDGLTWAVESDAGGRGMPPIIPTFDGGLVAVLDGLDGTTTLVRGWRGGATEQVRVDTTVERIVAVDGSGVALVEHGERFARVQLFADRGEFWTGDTEIDVGGTGELLLPGLNEAIIAEAPAWSFEPVTFGHAIAGAMAVNETRRIAAVQTSETTWTVTATTDGFFDDSVFADRFELELRRSDDGTFRFERGRWSQACAPGRGHQDFTPDLCA